MNLMKSVVAIGLTGALIGALTLLGCGTAWKITPGTGGGIGVEITTTHPPTNDIRELPKGFRACGSRISTVELEGGEQVQVLLCFYCADDVNDPTVYIQHNCEGAFKKGMKNPNAGQMVAPPTAVKLHAVTGVVDPRHAKLEFQTGEAMTLCANDFAGAQVRLRINGAPAAEVLAAGSCTLPAGTRFSVDGTPAGVADVLYWCFGAGELTIRLDDGRNLELLAITGEEFGVAVAVRIDGVVQPNSVALLPWRR